MENSYNHRFSTYRNRKSSERNTVMLMLERLVAFNIGIINRIKRGKGVEFQPISRDRLDPDVSQSAPLFIYRTRGSWRLAGR